MATHFFIVVSKRNEKECNKIIKKIKTKQQILSKYGVVIRTPIVQTNRLIREFKKREVPTTTPLLIISTPELKNVQYIEEHNITYAIKNFIKAMGGGNTKKREQQEQLANNPQAKLREIIKRKSNGNNEEKNAPHNTNIMQENNNAQQIQKNQLPNQPPKEPLKFDDNEIKHMESLINNVSFNDFMETDFTQMTNQYAYNLLCED